MVSWNKYKVIPNKTYYANNYIRELLDASYHGKKRLFILAYDNTGDNPVTANSQEDIFFQEQKLKTIILKLMEEIFVISQLMM